MVSRGQWHIPSKNWPKYPPGAELNAKVRRARTDLQDKVSHCNQRIPLTCSEKGERQTFNNSLNSEKCTVCLFHYDDRKERLLKILFQILFLLEIIGAYLQVLLFQQTITFTCMVTFILSRQSCVTACVIQLFCVWMALLSSWLFAQVSLQPFLLGALTTF